jgi:hypothetical protein
MKNALVKVIANHMKSPSWNKDTVKERRDFEHLLELSEGKLNLTREELISTTDLLRTNKRISNKILPVGQPKIQSNKM